MRISLQAVKQHQCSEVLGDQLGRTSRPTLEHPLKLWTCTIRSTLECIHESTKQGLTCCQSLSYRICPTPAHDRENKTMVSPLSAPPPAPPPAAPPAVPVAMYNKLIDTVLSKQQRGSCTHDALSVELNGTHIGEARTLTLGYDSTYCHRCLSNVLFGTKKNPLKHSRGRGLSLWA